MANKIQLRRGTKAQLATLGALSVAEPGYCTDTKELFIGNASGGNTPLVTATSADITYYVRTDGNDSNNGLANTAAGAFKTWQKALDSLPKVINHSVNIYIADGTYAEDVVIRGFKISGAFSVVGNVTTLAVNVNSITLHSISGALTVEGLTLTSTTKDAITINRCSGFRVNNCKSTSAAPNGNGAITYFSYGYINQCTFSNKGNGVNANGVSQIFLIGTAGTGNTNALAAAEGAIIVKWDNTITGTRAENTAGGIITAGVVNPWGDNTQSSRSRIEAGPNGAQWIAANTFTKINYGTEYGDTLGEYTPATARFTAKTLGNYLISVQVGLVGGVTTPVRGILELWVNGGAGKVRISDFTTGSGADFSATGAASIALAAGDYVEVYLLVTSPKDVSINTAETFMRTIRVA